MNFIHSDVFILIPVALGAAGVLMYHAARKRRAGLKQLLGSSDSGEVAVKLSRGRRTVRYGLLLLTMLFLIGAAARPFWDSQLVPYEPHGRDLLVLFDVSKSMKATDLAPSRLEHAKFLLRRLVEREGNDRFGLIPFAGTAYLSCPLTSDKVAFNQYIDELDPDAIPLGGTNMEIALSKAVEAFKAAAGGNRAIVIFTDGDELSGDSTRVIAELKKKGIPLFVVGLGDPAVGAPVPEEDGRFKRDAAGQLVTTKLNEENIFAARSRIPDSDRLRSGSGPSMSRSKPAAAGPSRSKNFRSV